MWPKRKSDGGVYSRKGEQDGVAWHRAIEKPRKFQEFPPGDIGPFPSQICGYDPDRLAAMRADDPFYATGERPAVPAWGRR